MAVPFPRVFSWPPLAPVGAPGRRPCREAAGKPLPQPFEKVAAPRFSRITLRACAVGAGSAPCRESLAPQGFSLAAYMPPLTIKASEGFDRFRRRVRRKRGSGLSAASLHGRRRGAPRGTRGGHEKPPGNGTAISGKSSKNVVQPLFRQARRAEWARRVAGKNMKPAAFSPAFLKAGGGAGGGAPCEKPPLGGAGLLHLPDDVFHRGQEGDQDAQDDFGNHVAAVVGQGVGPHAVPAGGVFLEEDHPGDHGA